MARIASWGRISFGMLVCVAACASSPAVERRPAAMATPATSDAAESRRAQKSAVAPPAGAPAPVSPAAEPPSAALSPARQPSVDVGSSSAEFTRRIPVEAVDPHGASGARVRLAEARRELEIATSERDCVRACRALESMERAAQQVCELARSPEERRECTSAGEQVDKARSKVQSVCGGCPQKLR